MKRQFRPAGGAQADAVAERLAAGRAERRQRHVERQRAARRAIRRGTGARREGVCGPGLPRQARSCCKCSRCQSNPTIFDRKLLRARRSARARSGRDLPASTGSPPNWPSGCRAVLRQFERAVDLGTPTDAVRRALADSGKVGTIVAAAPAARRRCAAARRRRRGGVAVRRRLARSGRLGAVAAVRQ